MNCCVAGSVTRHGQPANHCIARRSGLLHAESPEFSPLDPATILSSPGYAQQTPRAGNEAMPTKTRKSDDSRCPKRPKISGGQKLLTSILSARHGMGESYSTSELPT
jgi:hypothetical protein